MRGLRSSPGPKVSLSPNSLRYTLTSFQQARCNGISAVNAYSAAWDFGATPGPSGLQVSAAQRMSAPQDNEPATVKSIDLT